MALPLLLFIFRSVKSRGLLLIYLGGHARHDLRSALASLGRNAALSALEGPRAMLGQNQVTQADAPTGATACACCLGQVPVLAAVYLVFLPSILGECLAPLSARNLLDIDHHNNYFMVISRRDQYESQ